MKPSRSKEERDNDQIDRGLAAERLLGDAVVQAWFAKKDAEFVQAMVGAKIEEDQKRRDCAVKINLIRELKQHLETESTMGRNASKQLEKAKSNG